MKEIFGWLLIGAIVSLTVIVVSYGPMRPLAIFPKWKTIRRTLRRVVRIQEKAKGRAAFPVSESDLASDIIIR